MLLIGHDVALALFGTLNVIGERMNLGGRKVVVVGVFAKKGKILQVILWIRLF